MKMGVQSQSDQKRDSDAEDTNRMPVTERVSTEDVGANKMFKMLVEPLQLRAALSHKSMCYLGLAERAKVLKTVK